MNTEDTLQSAAALLAPWAANTNSPSDNRLDVNLTTDDLPEAARALHDAGWGYLAAITGLDLGPEAGELEVLYHYCQAAAVLTLRLKLEREEATVPTLCGIVPSAGFFERELSEMLDITVVGAPNTDYLFLPDNWPKSVYPLRKDFQSLAQKE